MFVRPPVSPGDDVVNERSLDQAAPTHHAGTAVRLDLQMIGTQPAPCPGAVVADLLWSPAPMF